MVDEEKQENLKNMGVKDSKLLTQLKRERLFDDLQEVVKYEIIIINPSEIDSYVLSETGDNLNWLEAQKSAEIINRLQPEKAILDCPSQNTKAYKEYVTERLLHKKLDIKAEHKADFNYPIVAAASILAKVTRDAELAKIKKDVGEDFGSGYMADPKTAAFLKKNWNKYPSIFRQSWAPYQALQKGGAQKKLI